MNDNAKIILLKGFISELKLYGPDNIMIQRKIKDCDDENLKELMKICIFVERDRIELEFLGNKTKNKFLNNKLN